jgi:hypothetical protein
MKRELFLLLGTWLYISDTWYDGYYTSQLKHYKKHAKIAGTVFVAYSLYSFIYKHPMESSSLLTQFYGVLKFLPIDSQTKSMLSMYNPAPREDRILASGDSSTRCVSGTKKKWVAANQGWKCNICNGQLNAWFEVDHITRLADGGTNEVSNLVALCRNCHGEKTTLENL